MADEEVVAQVDGTEAVDEEVMAVANVLVQVVDVE